jgi:perosamine synthetase
MHRVDSANTTDRTVPFGRPMLGEAERTAVQKVLEGPTLVHGPASKAFEASFADWTGAPHAVSVSSCTAAMHLVWFLAGIGPGDEVLVPAQTHTATAHAVELTGARAVFVDARPEDGNVDPEALAAAVTERTVGIAIVHYLGEPVEMGPIVELASSRGLLLLEDCALAVGTSIDGVHAGLIGDVGCFSFYPVKHFTTAEGGMAITKDPQLAARLERARAFGVDRTAAERTEPGVYDAPTLGFNYRMSELHAAIGVEQLKRIDGFLADRRRNFAALAAGLRGIDGLRVLPASDGMRTGSRYCLAVVLDRDLAGRRAEIVARLSARGVGSSIYYPRPVPLMTYYAERYGYRASDYPVAAEISASSIALPVGPHLDEDDMAYIAQALRESVG